MLAGRSAIRPITGFDTADLPVRIGGEVPDFKAGDHMDRRSAGRMDAFARYAVAAAREAIAMANLTVTDENRNRIATAIASCHGGIASLEKAVAALREHGAARVGPLTIPLSLPNMGGSQISLALGLHGPTVTPAAACASGTQAILDGITMIERGEADVVIAGGTDATLTPLGIAGYAALGALSPGNGDPARVSRPFAASRDGFVLSEGAAAMILESEEHAVRRGATVLAFAPGAGATSDAYHLTSPDPSGAQAARAMSIALERSGLSAGACRLRGGPRDQHQGRGHRRNECDPDCLWRARRPDGRLRDQVAGRAPARCGGGAGGGDLRPGDPGRRGPPNDQPRRPRSGLRPRLRPPHRPPDAGPRGNCERVWVWWAERLGTVRAAVAPDLVRQMVATSRRRPGLEVPG